MAYTPSTWLETNLTTNQKLSFLDNLETMYDEIVSYINAITHGSSYYTDAEAAAKFFSSSNDGTGSGLVCATLDGYTAQQIIDVGSPSGGIGIWSGSEASIPAGWVLCNGLNSTPDLRSKFVIGAGGTYGKGTTGGGATATPTASAVTIGTFALTADHLPAHTHGYTDYYRGSAGAQATSMSGNGTTSDHSGKKTTAATSDAHGHAGSTFSGSACDILPAYWALCFIMKS